MRQALFIFLLCLANQTYSQEVFITSRWCHNEKALIRIDSLSGLEPPFMYSFTERVFTKNNSYSPDSAGVYNIIIAGSKGDTAYASTHLIQSKELRISSVTKPTSCSEAGSYRITNVSGGIEPYEIKYNGELKEFTNSNGTVTIKDAAGCQSQFSNSIPRICPQPYTGFSPNGDGLNDTWEIEGVNNLDKLWVRVSNRFGQPVFESEGSYTPWDGTPIFGGKLSSGSYIYQIHPFGKNSSEHVVSGILMISR